MPSRFEQNKRRLNSLVYATRIAWEQAHAGRPRPSRQTLAWLAAPFAVAAVVGYSFRTQVVNWLEAPLYNAQLSAENYPSSYVAFQAIIMALGLTAILFASYAVLVGRRHSDIDGPADRLFAWVYPLVTITGFVCLIYFVAMPVLFQALSTVDIDQIHTYITASSYRPFATIALITWSAELQLIAVSLMAKGIRSDTLAALTKYHMLIEGLGSALIFILPIAPDPISKLMLALPLVAASEVGTYLIGRVRARRSRRSVETAPGNVRARDTVRLPMAIAVPHKPAPTQTERVDRLRAPMRRNIDMRVIKSKPFDDHK